MIEFCGIPLAHPIVNGSGTFDAIAARRAFGDELLEHFPFAAFVSKTVTVAPRGGNPPPRLWEAPAGLINSIGLPNKGLDNYLAQDLPQLAELPVPLVVNVMGFSREEVAALVGAFAGRPEVAALELNVSCPNVDKGGMEFGCDPAAAARVTEACRAATRLPLWVKMSPEAGEPKKVGLACQEAGADALTAINTIRGLSIDVHTWKPRLANATGGLSGPALKPIAIRLVWELSRAVTIPIIGIGGIARTEDAIEFMLAGASAVQVGTANFADPMAAKKVLEGLRDYCAARGLAARELIGKLDYVKR